MELIYKKMDGFAILSGCNGSGEHIEIEQEYDGLPVVEISPGVFAKHDELVSVKIPMTLLRIGAGAFRKCSALKCICVAAADDHSVFPPTLNYVGDRAFEGTAQLHKITFCSPRLELGRYAFFESGVVDVWFYDANQVALSDGVFMRCSALEFVSFFETGIDGLPAHSFAYCGKLRKLLAPYLAGTIGCGCFYNCFELAELPVRETLLSVGEEAFSGCKNLNTNGYFRTMRDVLNGFGKTDLVKEILRQKSYHCTWGPKEHIKDYLQRTQEIGQEVLREIHSTPRTPQTNCILINALSSEYFSKADGFDLVQRFYLFEKNHILRRFKTICCFDITFAWDWDTMQPPVRVLDDLTWEDVEHLLMFENHPKPQHYCWDKDLRALLDAELAGDALQDQGALAVDFLSRLIDHKMHPNWTDTRGDIPNDLLTDELPEDESDECRLHRLKYDVLFNRIYLYQELKKAHFQLSAEMYHRK